MNRATSIIVRALAVFVVAFLPNWIWETAQLPFYAAYEDLSVVHRFVHCLPATVADAFYTVLIYWAGVIALRDERWITNLKHLRSVAVAFVGAATAIVVESLALNNSWWIYAPAMPRVPVFGVGLLPVMQLATLPLMTFLFARRMLRNT